MSGCVCVRVAEEYRDLEGWVSSIPDAFYADSFDAQTLHDGRNVIRRYEVGGHSVVVKYYRRISPLNKFVYAFLRKNKAVRSFEYSQEYLRRGISVPKPVACVTVKRYGMVVASYYISEYCPDLSMSASFDEPLTEQSATRVNRCAEFLSRLHSAGISHGDLNASNILYRDVTNEQIEFTLIDLNRSHFYRKALGERRRYEDLARVTRNVETFNLLIVSYSSYMMNNRTVTIIRALIGMLIFNRRYKIHYMLKHPLRYFSDVKSFNRTFE